MFLYLWLLLICYLAARLAQSCYSSKFVWQMEEIVICIRYRRDKTRLCQTVWENSNIFLCPHLPPALLCFPWIKESSVDLKTFLESLERLKPLIKPCSETFIASFPNRKSIFTFHKEEGHEVRHQETSTWLYLSIYLYHFISSIDLFIDSLSLAFLQSMCEYLKYTLSTRCITEQPCSVDRKYRNIK